MAGSFFDAIPGAQFREIQMLTAVALRFCLRIMPWPSRPCVFKGEGFPTPTPTNERGIASILCFNDHLSMTRVKYIYMFCWDRVVGLKIRRTYRFLLKIFKHKTNFFLLGNFLRFPSSNNGSLKQKPAASSPLILP